MPTPKRPLAVHVVPDDAPGREPPPRDAERALDAWCDAYVALLFRLDGWTLPDHALPRAA